MNSFSKRSVIEVFQRAKAVNTQVWRDTLPTWCPGCGHLTALHGLYEAVRNNFDITYVILDNSIYGLTKGQISPIDKKRGIVCPSYPRQAGRQTWSDGVLD
jgi:pyruvate/2-oxoacid:ferredoxin oxidoreductase beta subunit